MRSASWIISFLLVGCAANVDIEPCGTATITSERKFTARTLDVLFVVDDSPSMASEADHLAIEIPRMARRIASGDLDADGVRDFVPASLTRAAVITTDLGGSVDGLAGCVGAGDDGLLVACDVGPGFSEVARDGDAAAFATEIACATSAGSSGCGVEQPFEAVLRALSVDAPTSWTRAGYVPPTFRDGGFGHGADANAGFLRPRSALIVVIFTNEDDCSVADVDDEAATGERDPACSGASLHPVERFVEGLLGLRALASSLSVLVVAGVDPRLLRDGFQEILDDPSMASAQVSCTSSDGRTATAPRRLVEALAGLERRGVHTALESICSSSFVGPEAFAPIESRAGTDCLPRPLALDEEGRPDCEAVFTLAPAESGVPFTRCDRVPYAERVGTVADVGEEGEPTVREVCRVRALAPSETPTSVGWYYVDEASQLEPWTELPEGCAQGIGHTWPSIEGSEVRITCRERVDLPTCAEP